jgi:hypothetical protein
MSVHESTTVLSDTLHAGGIVLQTMESMPTFRPESLDDAMEDGLRALHAVVELCVMYPIAAFDDDEVALVQRISDFCANEILKDFP